MIWYRGLSVGAKLRILKEYLANTQKEEAMEPELVQPVRTRLDRDGVTLGDFLRRDERVYPERYATESRMTETHQNNQSRS